MQHSALNFRKYKMPSHSAGDSSADFDLLASLHNADPTDLQFAIDILTPRHAGHDLIRIGKDGDGGYLLPSDIRGIEGCFSPGVNNFKDFEDDLAHRYQIPSYMIDYTSDAHRLQTPLIQGLQHFDKKWLDIDGAEHSITLDNWVNHKAPGGGDLLLQMDIEGAEYRNLAAVADAILDRFRIIVLELHDLWYLPEEWFLKGVFRPSMYRIAERFTCVHSHPNNCCGSRDLGNGVVIPNAIEITFLRNDRRRPSEARVTLPHPADADNVPGNPPLLLQGDFLRHADPVLSPLASLQHQLARLNQQLSNHSDRLERLEATVTWTHANSLTKDQIISVGCPATQSSLSQWSRGSDAGRAVSGVFSHGSFSFHTDLELDPWWEVDLGSVASLDSVVIYNRTESFAGRSSTLKLLLSSDGINYALAYDHAGRKPFGGITSNGSAVAGVPPLCVVLAGARARYVRIQIAGYTYLALDQIEVYRAHQHPRAPTT